MKKVEIAIAALAPTNAPQYVIVMREVDGWRRLPIVIGTSEAHAIAIELENISRPRPMTHDLFVNTLSAFGIILNEVVITKVKDGVFFSELVCEQSTTGTTIRLDSRTSDAIALAIRFKCRIYTYEEVMAKSAFSIKEFNQEKASKSRKEKLKHKIELLEEQLKKTVEQEDYELASKIRDEIQQIKDELDS
ncbi:MAG: bifunctional nuclease family protein [Bacteroidales bacterium]|nr:bifunctional nuclease family protein [Bacteroidales bacterium]